MRSIPFFVQMREFLGHHVFFAQESLRKQPPFVWRQGLRTGQGQAAAFVVLPNCFTNARPPDPGADDKIIALNHVRIFDDRKSLSVLAREKFNPAISLLESLVAAAVLTGSHFREPRDKSATGAITPTTPRACSRPACSRRAKDT